MKSRDIGLAGEESAALYLEKRGYRIIGRRVRIGRSEVDIIADNEECTVFVEVKTRRAYPVQSDFYSGPAAAVDSRKQVYLTRAAEEYLTERRAAEHDDERFFRIDVVEVYVDPKSESYRVLDIVHTENAVKRRGKFSMKANIYNKNN